MGNCFYGYYLFHFAKLFLIIFLNCIIKAYCKISSFNKSSGRKSIPIFLLLAPFFLPLLILILSTHLQYDAKLPTSLNLFISPIFSIIVKPRISPITDTVFNLISSCLSFICFKIIFSILFIFWFKVLITVKLLNSACLAFRS